MGKTYRIEIYKGMWNRPQGGARSLADVFSRLATGTPPVMDLRGHQFELRDVVSFNNGASFRGSICKFRMRDLPSIGAPGGSERQLPIEEDEGLLEKIHFLFFRRRNLLVYQANHYCCAPSVLGEYLSNVAGTTVSFGDILRPAPLERLIEDNFPIRRVEISIARPTNPALVPAGEWGPAFDLLRMSGGQSVTIEFKSDARLRDEGKYLRSNFNRSVSNFVSRNRDFVKKAEATVEDHGLVKPIDLLADSLYSLQDVEMDGRYPEPDSIYAALDRALRECRAEIERYFGTQGDVGN